MSTSTVPRVLCLSPFFAPLANAEAFCGNKVALQLLDAGVDLTVLDVDYAGHAKFSNDPSALWQPLQRITTSIPPGGGRSRLTSAPLGLRYLTPEWSRWIAAVVARARTLHRERPFDVVYSRSLPNVAHIAGYWVARALQRPWLANFNDPWDLEGAHLQPQDRDKRKRTTKMVIADFWLRRVMTKANAITFPCTRLRDYHLRLVPTPVECMVVPHIGSRSEPVAPAEFFQLVHAGNLGSGESTRRNSTISLLRALAAFFERRPEARQLFRLVLVGPEDKPTLALARELNLESFISCTGRVSYFESLQRMASATVCLLVEGNMPEGIFLPSKLPDYVQAGKPVIALSPSIGTVADLAPYPGVTQVSVADQPAIEAAIGRHYDAFARGQIASLAPSQELRDLYDGRKIGRQLRDLLSSLAARGPA